MASVCCLTTFDNPFDPFEQFIDWWLFDTEKGYDTCGLLARTVKSADDSTEKEEYEEIERAIDTIIQNDFMNIYKKVKKQEKKAL